MIPDDDDLASDDDDVADEELEPTTYCVQLLECLSAAGSDDLSEVTSLYDSGSTCWEDEDAAAECDQACLYALRDYEYSYPGLEACWDDGKPDANKLFPEQSPWSWETGNCNLGLDGAQSRIRGITHDEFEFEGFVIQEGYQFEFQTICTFSTYDFTCEDYVDYADIIYQFEGSFSGRFQTAEWLFTVVSEGQNYDCYLNGSKAN